MNIFSQFYIHDYLTDTETAAKTSYNKLNDNSIYFVITRAYCGIPVGATMCKFGYVIKYHLIKILISYLFLKYEKFYSYFMYFLHTKFHQNRCDGPIWDPAFA